MGDTTLTPDAYMAQKPPPAGGLTPDAFMAQQSKYGPPQSDWEDTKQLAQGVGSRLYGVGKALASGAEDIYQSHDPLQEIVDKAKGMATGVVQPMYEAAERFNTSFPKLMHGDIAEALPSIQHAAGVLPFVGPVDAAYEKAVQEKKATGRVNPDTLADATTSALLTATPAATRAAAGFVRAASPIVRAGAQAVRDVATPENIGTAVGGAAGGYAGHLVGDPLRLGVAAGGTAGRVFGKAIGKRLGGTVAVPEAIPPTPPAEPLAASPAVPVTIPGGTATARPIPSPVQPISMADEVVSRGTPAGPGDISAEVQAVRQADIERRIKFGSPEDRVRAVQENAALASPEVQEKGWQRANDLQKRKMAEPREAGPSTRGPENPYAGEPPNFAAERASQRAQSGVTPPTAPVIARVSVRPIAPPLTSAVPPPISEYPPARPTVFGNPPTIAKASTPQERLWEDKIAQDEARARTDVEDRARFAAINRARFPGGATKGELTGQAVRPVKLTKMPPATEDLTDDWQKAVEAAKAAKKRK